MGSFGASPLRNLVGGLCFVLLVMAGAIAAYMANGWSFSDALYMAVITVYTVGYDEVRAVDTPALRAITIALVVLGCTGMIFLTGVLVQFFAFAQFQTLLGHRRMQGSIEALKGHTIICGFGRIGAMLAQELHGAGTDFVVLERGHEKFEEARDRGYLCIHADATDEHTLITAGVDRAATLATVLPDDAANVFITLSARSLNAEITILARGEAPSTERKLLQAGASAVVLPAHIGAERIAELILYPKGGTGGGSALKAMETNLRRTGLAVELAVAAKGSRFAGRTVGEIEHAAGGAFLIVGIERPHAPGVQPPQVETRVDAGDGVLVMGRAGLAQALEGFTRAS
jgi:voltage-gated potassium channel Kch